MPLADIKNIPSFESAVFEQGSPDDDEPPICKKGRSVGSARKPVKSNHGTYEPSQSLSDTIKETSTSNENKVWHEDERMAFTKHKSLRDDSHLRCSCWCSEKECTAVLKVFDDGQVSISDAHATSCSHKNGVTVSSSLVSTAGNVCKDRMHYWVENHATDADHLHDTPAVVWHDCVAHFIKEVGLDIYCYCLDTSQLCNLCTILRKELLVAILSPKMSHNVLGQITRLSFIAVHHLPMRRKYST
jgi:hypothetical protein